MSKWSLSKSNKTITNNKNGSQMFVLFMGSNLPLEKMSQKQYLFLNLISIIFKYDLKNCMQACVGVHTV